MFNLICLKKVNDSSMFMLVLSFKLPRRFFLSQIEVILCDKLTLIKPYRKLDDKLQNWNVSIYYKKNPSNVLVSVI